MTTPPARGVIRWGTQEVRVQEGPGPARRPLGGPPRGHTCWRTMRLKDDPRDSRFGELAPFTLGVEEELLLVGPDNELIDQGARVVREADPDDGEVTTELFKAMVEARSEVSANAAEAADGLRSVRRELGDSGARLMGAGVHPTAPAGLAD